MHLRNEADVREEVAAPFLAALGYHSGTANDILREISLSCDRNFLGRKKKNDPPLRGRADYVLSVLGVTRWILEVKAPNEPITRDAIDQAVTYARHPYVSGAYAVILNGVRCVIYHAHQNPADDPIVDIEVTSPNDLATRLAGLLSPSAVRRDCSPPIVDLEAPVADGLRSRAAILSGVITYSGCTWDSNTVLPPQTANHFEEMCSVVPGVRANVTGGRVWRDAASRIRAQVTWATPHEAIRAFAENKRLQEVEFISLNTTISADPAAPTTFDFVGGVEVTQGEPIYDVFRWTTKFAEHDTTLNYRGQVVGSILGARFAGTFQSEYEYSFPHAPNVWVGMSLLGTFEIDIDPR